ncbi:hypothetical protein E5D57_001048 [Metarhizium anisopliae]|nr:hypothetical protein E5D57_001048 [Metarhizium anisopliae]
MEWDHELKIFDSCYSNVTLKVKELLGDVMDGWEGHRDPDENRRKELAKTICNVLEGEASKNKEAKQNKLSEAEMRGFVGELQDTFRTMIAAQKKNRPAGKISYDSVSRCIKTKKPAKDKGT